MPSTTALRSSAVVAAIGGAGGALLAYYLYHKRRRRQRGHQQSQQQYEDTLDSLHGSFYSSEYRERVRHHAALLEAQDRRNLLPSTIILVRHGESVGNVDSTVWAKMPDNLLPLTERGTEQAREAGRRVEHILSGRTKSMMSCGGVSEHSTHSGISTSASASGASSSRNRMRTQSSTGSGVRSVYLHSRHSGESACAVDGDSTRSLYPYSRHGHPAEQERGYGNGNAPSMRTLRYYSSSPDTHHQIMQPPKNDRIHLVLSPFERTLQTARAMRTSLEHRIVRTDIESRIREQEFGNIQQHRGDRTDENDFSYHRTQQKKVGRFWYRFPTGESGADVYDRVKSWWFESILNVNTRVGYEPIDAIVVVTHGLTMRFVLMQLFSWSPTTFHSVWNADNCEMYVLRKDLSKPGSSPYILDREAGDIPKSSIELWVEFLSGDKRTFTLKNYLSIPPPRTLRLDVVKNMLAEQYPEEIVTDDIVSIEFMPFVTSGEDGEDFVKGITPSGANCEKSDMIEQRRRGGKQHNHNRTRSQSNTFTQMATEHGLQRCDSCTCPIPTYNWMESY